MTEVIPRGKLTIEEHVDRIKKCLEKTRESIFQTVITIKKCKDDLGDDVFQNEISSRLGMSPSTLNRWLSIGSSQFVLENKENLPSTFSSLYDLTLLEKKYVEFYGETKSGENLQKLIETGKIGITSYQSDVRELLRSIELKIKNRSKRSREERIVDLVGGKVEENTQTTTLKKLIESGSKFRSFVVVLPTVLINRWGDSGVTELDIIEEFPLHEIRTPSISEVVTMLMVVPMNRINVGMKVITSFGFTYRDMFVPPQHWDQYHLMKNEMVILRSERGIGTPKTKHIPSTETGDVVDWVTTNCKSPYCLVFDSIKRDGWVNVTNVS